MSVSSDDYEMSTLADAAFESHPRRLPRIGARAAAICLDIARGASCKFAILQTFLMNILTQATNLANGILMARFLGVEGRGEAAAMQMCSLFVGSCISLGLPTALLYWMRKRPEDSARYLTAAALINLIVGCLGAGIGILIVPHWLTGYPHATIVFAQYTMLTIPLGMMWGIIASALQSFGDFTRFNLFYYLNPGLTFVSSVVLILVHRLTPASASATSIAATLAPTVFMLPRVFSVYRLEFRRLREHTIELLTYGLRAYAGEIANTLAMQFDKIFVLGVLTPTAMGGYAVAIALSRLVTVFHVAMNTVILPKIVGRPAPEVIAEVGRMARISAVITCVAGAFVCLCGPFLIRTVYGRDFGEAATVLPYLCGEVAIGATSWSLAQAFFATGKPGLVTLLQIIGISFALPLLFILTPRLGLTGVGIALLASAVARLIFTVTCFPVVLKLRPPSLWPRRDELMQIARTISMRLSAQ